MRFGFGFGFGSRIRKDSDSEKFRFVLPLFKTLFMEIAKKTWSFGELVRERTGKGLKSLVHEKIVQNELVRQHAMKLDN